MTASSLGRRSDRATWLIGLIDGILLGVLGLEFGVIGLAVLVAIAVTMLLFRNLLMLSGLMFGAGGVWVALLVRQAILICGEPGRLATDSCISPGLTAYTLIGGAFLVAGIALGVVARRRRPVWRSTAGRRAKASRGPCVVWRASTSGATSAALTPKSHAASTTGTPNETPAVYRASNHRLCR
jgi:hypothetical protein